MKLFALFMIVAVTAFSMNACQSSGGKKTFADTACNNETIRFNLAHVDSPFLRISIRDCDPDSLIWGHKKLPSERSVGFFDMTGKIVRLNKKNVSAYFNDTSYVWLKFNDAVTGRGYLLKLPFKDKGMTISKYTSALNNFDPKFSVEDGLLCYTDGFFVYVQDQATGATEKMLLNKEGKVEADYDNIHRTYDSVNITRKRIYVNLLLNGEKKPLEKSINL